MLFAIDFDESFIDVEGVAVASVISLQSAGINGTKFYAPQTDCFPANSDASLGEKIFDITMAEVESIVEPACVADYILRESVAFISIHASILSISAN